jgi:hypothetical protein
MVAFQPSCSRLNVWSSLFFRLPAPESRRCDPIGPNPSAGIPFLADLRRILRLRLRPGKLPIPGVRTISESSAALARQASASVGTTRSSIRSRRPSARVR